MPFPDQNKSLIELQAWALDFAKDDLQLNAINQVIASFVNKNIQGMADVLYRDSCLLLFFDPQSFNH